MNAGDDLGGLDRVSANERLFLAGSRRHVGEEAIVFHCECTLPVCDQRLDLTTGQYSPIRASAARYAVYPQSIHVDPGVDEVVERNSSHWVVERQGRVEVVDFFRSDTSEPELRPEVAEGRFPAPIREDDPRTSA